MKLGFDISAARSELAIHEEPATKGRKLTFASKCAAFAALYLGAKPHVVAQVFGVTETTAIYLGGCITDTRAPVVMELPDVETFTEAIETDNRPSTRQFVDVTRHNVRDYVVGDPNISHLRRADRKPRYPDIAAEFHRLGAEQFCAAYYTDQVRAAVLEAQKNPQPRRRPFAPNPKADQFKGVHEIINQTFIRIVFIPNEGWAWSECTLEGKKWPSGWEWHGEEKPGARLRAFRTSEGALGGARQWYGPA